MTGIDDLHYVNPFNRYTWHGRFVPIEGADASDFTEADVAEVVAHGATTDEWDGTAAAVLLLNDGRFVTYEAFYGPTGNGFSEDAYGGNADIYFAPTLDAAVRWGLTDEGRRLCGIEQPDGSCRTAD